MWKLFCAFLLVVLVADTQASPGDYCIDVSDCDSGECCQILSPIQVASKKRGLGGNSTCQRYQRLGESCNLWDTWNGYCGCEPGTKCTYHPPPAPEPQPTILPSPTQRRPTTYYPTPPPPITTMFYPDTTASTEDPPSGRKKRAIYEGATYDCQPI